MRAVYYDQTGPAEAVLSIGDMPDPVPGRGEVLVRVMASGINPADVKRRAGWGGLTMEHPRVIPHTDGAGVIEAVGEGVPNTRMGQRVWLWNAQGGYGEAGRAFGTAADYIAIPSKQAVPLPDHFTFEAGACLGVPAMTAHRCVLADGPVQGQTILIQGAAGAVGYLATQIAVQERARVIASVSNEDDADRLAQIGAAPILRHAEDVAARVMSLTDGAGVDRIVEVDFAANRDTDAAVIESNGVLASYSSSSDPRPELDYYAFASKGVNLRFIQGFALPETARHRGEDWLQKHGLHIPIRAKLPLERCAEAHALVEQGASGRFGQVVLGI